MELIKRVLGFHKTPPVLVDAFLYELECIIHEIVPPKGRRVGCCLSLQSVALQTPMPDEEFSPGKGRI